MNKNYIGRLAPSPTGALHLGNARSFLIAWLDARYHNGKLLMRMEDLNTVRVKEGSVESIYADLAWMGLDWDQGPGQEFFSQNKEPNPNDYIQSSCLSFYDESFQKLLDRRRLYPCICTRKEIAEVQSAPHSHDLRYPGTCRDLYLDEEDAFQKTGKKSNWRFKIDHLETSFMDRLYGTQVSQLNSWSGDFTIALSERRYSYQLAVVVDDARQGINQVVRAEDLLMSTHRQLALIQALGLTPPQYLHLPLVVGEDGRRLAKRHGDWKLSRLRQEGLDPKNLVGLIAYSLGWAEKGERITPTELLNRYNTQNIPKEPWIIDSNTARELGVDLSWK